MHEIERVPDPQIAMGVRASREYKDQFLDRIAHAYSEDIITDDERVARSAVAHREGVTTDDLRRLTKDLPERAEPDPRLSAKTRVVLYIAAGATSVGFMVGAPVAVSQIMPHQFNLLTAVGAVIAFILGLAALISTVFCAFNDKVVVKEYA